MSKSMSGIAKLAVLAAIVVVMTAGAAQAQHFLGGQGGGGSGLGAGIGTPYSGGSSFGGYPYGYTSYPYGSAYGGYSYSAPYYTAYPYGYSAPYSYGYSTPYYYGSPSYFQSGTASMPAAASYQSFYPPEGTLRAQTTGSASIQVVVPAKATITFDGAKTQQTGPSRLFTTPSIDGPYTYEVCATWTDQSGKEIRRTRTVHVAPNQHSFVNFMDGPSLDTNGARDNNKNRK